MKYKPIANTGVYVSELCLGAMTFGSQWEVIGALGQTEADALVHRSIDAGVNFFDTADVYSAGDSEEILGKSLAAHRHDVVIATKVRGRMGPGANAVGLSRLHIIRAAEASLRRLKRFSNRPCTTWGGRGTSARTDAGGPMRAYSMDLRERALLDSDAGMKAADVAAKYRVSGSWVRLLKQRRRETGEVAPRVQRHGRRCMLEPHLHTLAALIAAQPDRTLAELKDALATPASVPTVWRAVRALGLTVKKNGPPVRTRSA